MKNKKYKILLIDDEKDLCHFHAECLGERYICIFAHNGEEGFRTAQNEKPDLIVLDINMPGENGLAVCKRLRDHQSTKHIPVLMLTGDADPKQKLEAYNYGADDFLEKPILPEEFRAIVASKIRRVEEREPAELHCGNLNMNADQMTVRVAGNIVPFSILQFNLLRFFILNKNKVVSRDTILSHVWPGVAVMDRTIDTHIVSIRKKLDHFDHELDTIYGAGYVLKSREISPRA